MVVAHLAVHLYVLLVLSANKVRAEESDAAFFFTKEAPVGSADTAANAPAVFTDDDDSPAPDKYRPDDNIFDFLSQIGEKPKMLDVLLDPATAFSNQRSSDSRVERSFTWTMQQEWCWLP